MTTRIRSTARRTTLGAAALVLALAGTACTGDGDSSPEQDSGTGQQSTDTGNGSGTEQETEDGDGDPAASDGGGATDAPATEEDLAAASDRMVELLQVMDDQDWEAACGFVLDPTTGTAPEGERLAECADDVEPTMAPLADQLEPGMFDQLDPTMVQAQQGGDGTVTTSVMGQPLEVHLVRGEDGRWYVSIPF